jgi:hypothetical protein
MIKLIDELELSLERLVREKMDRNYSSREQNQLWVYESFSNWLVNKFKEDTKVS